MNHSVVIVGAGPVGLFLAIELAIAGVKPLVIERLPEANRTIKAAGIGAVAAEALERRGLGPLLAEEERAAMAGFAEMVKARYGGGPIKRPGGHFSALFLLDRDLQREPERRMRAVPQEALERILAVRAAELAIEIRRGVVVEGLAQDDASVTIETSAGPLRANYLVGCDGGRSAVRKLTKIAFPGTDATLLGHQAVVELDAPEKLAAGWQRTPRGLVVSMPGGRVFTAQFGLPLPDRELPVSLEEMQTALQRVTGADMKVLSMQMATRWTDNARQATSYREGRIFLAGDAAHVHSPLGGQGLNLGIVDAANLGFKLARAVHGRDDLLDSYTAERHPVGASVLENTRAQIALLRPDPLTSALRNVFGSLLATPDANRLVGEMLTGAGVRYDLGDDDPRVGTLAGDRAITLADGTERRLYDLLQGGGGLLLARAERSLPRGVRLALVADDTAMLIRPDGCVAWTDASSKPLDEALERWF